jgi:hypothetical protein
MTYGTAKKIHEGEHPQHLTRELKKREDEGEYEIVGYDNGIPIKRLVKNTFRARDWPDLKRWEE